MTAARHGNGRGRRRRQQDGGAKDAAVRRVASRLEEEDGQGARGRRQATLRPRFPLRSNFSETAFWQPQLLTGPDGSASLEFTVPDSVTAWSVWVHAVTRDLQGGSVDAETRSVKELMVRPYVPRFLREGDRAELEVVVNNASDEAAAGTLTFDILDPGHGEERAARVRRRGGRRVAAVHGGRGRGTNLTFPGHDAREGLTVAFKAVGDGGRPVRRRAAAAAGAARAACTSSQSRFVTLRDKDRETLTLRRTSRADDDPTLVNEQMVVTVDAQLFYSVLQALPYLVNYPYECTEQTLNRFVSTGIVSSVYGDYPAVAKMAAEMSKRTTRSRRGTRRTRTGRWRWRRRPGS